MIPPQRNEIERLELANQLYREFHTRCFWHSPRDLVITEELIPFVIKGLRQNGGRRGFILAGNLLRGEEAVRLDWTTDSAFRFFPVQPDQDFGYCLHPADLATNKVLALAGRQEIRDFLDILWIDRTYLSLGAVLWAACGKDPGYTPALILDQANRHSRYQESDLKTERLARPVDLGELKKQWLAARERAERLFERLPAEELGCLYLDESGRPVTPEPGDASFVGLRRHVGSVKGAWPRFR